MDRLLAGGKKGVGVDMHDRPRPGSDGYELVGHVWFTTEMRRKSGYARCRSQFLYHFSPSFLRKQESSYLQMFSYKSCHSGLLSSISHNFHERFHALICFSRVIALFAVWWASYQIRRCMKYFFVKPSARLFLCS
jgi:hypothetical protein